MWIRQERKLLPEAQFPVVGDERRESAVEIGVRPRLSLDELYSEEKLKSLENSLDIERQKSLKAKISPCLNKGLHSVLSDCPQQVAIARPATDLSSVFVNAEAVEAVTRDFRESAGVEQPVVNNKVRPVIAQPAVGDRVAG